MSELSQHHPELSQSQGPSKQRIFHNRKHPTRRPNFTKRKQNEGLPRPKLNFSPPKAFQIQEKKQDSRCKRGANRIY